jgi:hypothetical protein
MLLLDVWNRQTGTNFLRKSIGDLGVARDRFHLSTAWICPERVSRSLALENASVLM